MLENSTFWVKVGLEFSNENIEPIIEIPNVFIGSFANFEVLRVKEAILSFLHHLFLKARSKSSRVLMLPLGRPLIQTLALLVSELAKSLIKVSGCSSPDW
jgi:hypothetical protein